MELTTNIFFYILAAATLIATLMSVTRRNPVHAVIYLVMSLFALALIFYLLGAPLIAAWEVIVYAGAIMVLFLFIIMILQLAPGDVPAAPGLGRWLPALLLGITIAACSVLMIMTDPQAQTRLPSFFVAPRAFGQALFTHYALAVEAASLQLLFAAVGAWYIGRPDDGKRADTTEGRNA